MYNTSTFLKEIKQQPDALKALTSWYSLHGVSNLKKASELISRQESVIFTGMGTSHFASHFIRSKLASFVKMINIETGELFDYNLRLIKQNESVVVISQSGEGIETKNLVEAIKDYAKIIAITNTPDSTLGINAKIVFPMYAGEEVSITNKTYSNTLAVLKLLEYSITGKSISDGLDDLNSTAREMETYLAQSSTLSLAEECADFIAPAESIHFIGRGETGVVSAYQAALVFMEGAKSYAHGFTSGAFRHGPIELCKRNHKAVIFAPLGKSYAKMLHLAECLAEYGSKVVLITNGGYTNRNIKRVFLPTKSETRFAYLAAIAFELLLYYTAKLRGYEAGEFEVGNKITFTD